MFFFNLSTKKIGKTKIFENDETLDRDSDDDDDLDAWVAHFEDNDAPIEWYQENILHEIE